MQYQPFYEHASLNLTGCGRDSAQPGKAWATSSFLPFPGAGVVLDLTLAPDVDPAPKILGLDDPQDVLAVGQNDNDHRLYVSHGIGNCKVHAFDPGQVGKLFPADGDLLFTIPDVSPGQLAKIGDWLLVTAGDKIYKYNLANNNGPTAVVIDITGSRVVAVTGEPNDAIIYYIHDSFLMSAQVNLDGVAEVSAGAGEKVSDGPLPVGATGQLSILLGHVLIPTTTVDSNEVVRVRPDGTVSVDVIDDYPAGVKADNTHSALCPNENGQVLSVSTTSYGIFDYFEAANILGLGIGFIPFTRIIQDPGPDLGRADTSVDPGYFFQVNKVPFGGSIHVMINHKYALSQNIASYKITLGGQEVLAPYTDLRWDIFGGNWQHIGLAPGPNGYAVRNVNDELWYNPHRGAIIPTGLVADGTHELTIEYLDDNAIVVESETHILLIENAKATVLLTWPTIAGVQDSPVCGCIKYGEKSDAFSIDYFASHPTNDATYSLRFYRAGHYLGAISQSGPVQPVWQTKDGITVFDIMGNCNVAYVSVHLSVSRLVTTGYGWIAGSETARGFTLVPDTIQLEG